MAGVPFLRGILPASARLIVEIPWGANLNGDASNWPSSTPYADITTDLWQANGQTITINPMGRSDEFSQAQPAMCGLVLDNTTGKYSKGPQSSNYPFVRRNTPLRISVTLNGITIFTRFFGYITTFEPHDDPSAKVAWVNVQAFGSVRRIQQGKSPSKSALYRDITTATVQPVAYWPFEDGSNAQQANSPIAGVPAATFNYLQVLGSPQFGKVDGPPGSNKLPDFSLQANFSAHVPNVGTATVWRVQCVAKTNPMPTAGDDVIPLSWFTNSRAVLNNIFIAPVGGTSLNGLSFQDSAGHTFQSGVGFDDGGWHEYRAVMTQSGGNIVLNVFVDGALIINQTYAGTLNNIPDLNSTGTTMATSAGFACGHYIVWNTNTGLPDTVDSMRGHPGEAAADRLTRLFAQEGGLGMPLVVAGSSSSPMGPQWPDTFLNLIRECEATDVGLLYDGLSQGANYGTRTSRHNQAATLTLDASAGQIDPPFEPKDDDQRNRNLIQVNRRNGTFIIAQDKTGPVGTDTIGVYDAQATVNTTSDGQLPNVGGWLLRLGTVDEPYRYPKLSLDLSAIPSKAFDWLSTAPGERIDIPNLSTVSSRHPPGTVSLILEGYSEVLSPYEWTVQANCSPYSPWIVDSLNGLFRLELANFKVGTGTPINPGATTVRIDRTNVNSAPFTTTAAYPADFPMDLNIGGWPIHVTAATWAGGAFDPFFLTTDPTPNTVQIPADTAPVKLWRPAALAL